MRDKIDTPAKTPGILGSDFSPLPENMNLREFTAKCFYTVGDHKKIMCSISGGYDSDIMMDMIERSGGHDKTTYVFYDTGLEYDATKQHLAEIEKKYDIQIVRLPPKKAIPTCVKEYGVPFWSKYVSNMFARLQKHGFQWEDAPFEELYAKYPRSKSALRFWCNDFKTRTGRVSKFNIEYVRGLKEFVMLYPPDFPISAKCCDYAKKDPAHEFLVDGGFDLNCVGVRKAEGGARATSYTTCFDAGWCAADNYRPLFWMSDTEKEIYRLHYGVKRSDCYEVWGMDRTGCAGCPFGKNFERELELVQEYEPKRYAALISVFGKSYDYTRRFMKFRSKVA